MRCTRCDGLMVQERDVGSDESSMDQSVARSQNRRVGHD